MVLGLALIRHQFDDALIVWDIVLAVMGFANWTIVETIRKDCMAIDYNLAFAICVHFGKVVSHLII